MFLKLNGAGNTLVAPAMQHTRVVMDVVLTPKAWARYLDTTEGPGFFNGSPNDTFSWPFSSVSKNGVAQTNDTIFVTAGERAIYEITMASVRNVPVYFLSDDTLAGNVTGDIYDIKIYNGAVLMAHYDMSLGNVQDQSGNGNHATLTGGTWTEETAPPATVRHLKMNGNAWIQMPTVTGNVFEIEMTLAATQLFSTFYILDARTGLTDGWLTNGNSYQWSVFEDGVSVSNGIAGVSRDKKILLRVTRPTTFTDNPTIFDRYGGNPYAPTVGEIYSIKLYDNSNLVAHYDMTTGTLQDQSGNGYHATTTGGEWAGETPTAQNYTVSLNDTLTVADTTLTKRLSRFKTLVDTLDMNDSLTQQRAIKRALSEGLTVTDSMFKATRKNKSDSVNLTDSFFKRITAAVVDSVTIGENTTVDSETTTPGQNKSLADTVLITDTIIKRIISRRVVDSVNLSDEENKRRTKAVIDTLTVTDTLTKQKGKVVLLTDSVNVTDSLFKAIKHFKRDNITPTDTTAKTAKISVTLYDMIVTTEKLQSYLPNAPELVGRVKVSGSTEVNIYITGKNTKDITLEGKAANKSHLKGGVD